MVDIIARALAAKALEDSSSSGDIFEVDVTTQYAVGGIAEGTDLNGKTWQQILTMMLYGSVAVPTLVAPSVTVELAETTANVGESFTTTGVVTFDRGSITPAYGTTGYRAGLPTSYDVNGTVYSSSATTLSFTLTIDNIVEGNNTVTVTVYHEAGEQPLDGAGNDYDSPYPAGSLTATVVITGVNPVIISQSDGTMVTLSPSQYTLTDEYIEIGVPAEISDEYKQTVALPPTLATVSGVQQYDNVRNVWDYIYGSAEASLASFNITTQSIEVGGETLTYTVYTNATVLIGPRQLRFVYTTGASG